MKSLYIGPLSLLGAGLGELLGEGLIELLGKDLFGPPAVEIGGLALAFAHGLEHLSVERLAHELVECLVQGRVVGALGRRALAGFRHWRREFAACSR